MSQDRIDADAVARAAALAGIATTQAQRETLAEELERVRAWADSLMSADTASVAPLLHPNQDAMPLREDVQRSELSPDAALVNAPSTQDGCFRVPRVVG